VQQYNKMRRAEVFNAKREAKRRKIHLVILPTSDAIETLKEDPDETNAILHVTC
jgi:hypothetical protein